MIELLGILHLLALGILSVYSGLKLSWHWLDAIITGFFLTWGNLILTGLLLSSLHFLDMPAAYGLLSLFIQGLLCYGVSGRNTLLINWRKSLNLSTNEKLLMVALLLIALLNALVAAGFPPNNYDSLTYHLPRIHFYLSQGHLGHFFTTNARQIYFPFNATLLQMPVVQYGLPDRLLNAINLMAWLVSGALIYRIAFTLFKQRKKALLSVFLGLTGTSVLAQATTTNNDLLLAVAVLGTVHYVFRWIYYRQTVDLLLAALTSGIAIGVKVSIAYFFPGLIVFILIRYFNSRRLRIHWQRYIANASSRYWVFAGLLCVLMGSPSYLINLAEKGKLAPDGQSKYVNTPWTLQVARQNTIALGLQATLTPPAQMAYQIFSLVDYYQNTAYKHTLAYYMNDFLYQNWRKKFWSEAQLAKFNNYRKKLISKTPVEDEVWYGFSSYAILFGFVLIGWIKRKNPFILFLTILVGFFVISYGVLMSWQPWAGRFFHAPFLLAAIIAGAGCRQILIGFSARLKKSIAYSFFLFIMLGNMAYLVNNQRRGILHIQQTEPEKLLTLIPEPLKELNKRDHVCIVRISGFGNSQRLYPLLRRNNSAKFSQSPHPVSSAYNIVAVADSSQLLANKHKLSGHSLRYLGKGQGMWFEIIKNDP